MENTEWVLSLPNGEFTKEIYQEMIDNNVSDDDFIKLVVMDERIQSYHIDGDLEKLFDSMGVAIVINSISFEENELESEYGFIIEEDPVDSYIESVSFNTDVEEVLDKEFILLYTLFNNFFVNLCEETESGIFFPPIVTHMMAFEVLMPSISRSEIVDLLSIRYDINSDEFANKLIERMSLEFGLKTGTILQFFSTEENFWS